MALDNAAIKEILQRLDDDREAYLASLSKVHETLARALSASSIQRSISPEPSRSPNERPRISFSRRSLNSNPGLTSPSEGDNPNKSSIFTGEESSDSDDDESLFTQEIIPSEQFSESDFRAHIRDHEWDEYARRILKPVLQDKELLRASHLFQDDEIEQGEGPPSSMHATVYEVGTDGAALRSEIQELSQSIWQSLNKTNIDPSKRQATGKITVIREPSPLLFAAIHLTMDRHFDMDGIFKLLSDESPTAAHMKGCFDSDPTQQRTFVFCFKYYTIVGDKREPMPWQAHDHNLQSTKSHIPVSSCSSIVALSLSGKPSTILRNRSRRAKATIGHVFDPFAPWRVLSIQCYPDWTSKIDTHDSNRHYVNGPEAFLVTLLAEYQDAQKRFFEIVRQVTAMSTPPQDFMFNRETRDKLLFEDDQLTYSRRYFWATQTLAVMNDNIQAMVSAYKDTFTEEVWTGEHKYIWPGKKDQSSRYSNWRKRMMNLKKLFEIEIEKLEKISAMNTQEIKDLKSLREQLYSGTSVVESREALKQAETTVQQNRNIKLLTLVTIFFLPLTFVTSVFGMTNMPQKDGFIPFGIVTAFICIPTYLLIGIINSHTGHSAVLEWYSRVSHFNSRDALSPVAHQIRKDVARASKPISKLPPTPTTPSEPFPPKAAFSVRSTPRRLSRSLASYDALTSRTGYVNSHSPIPESRELTQTFPEPVPSKDQHPTITFNLDSFKGSTSPSDNVFTADYEMTGLSTASSTKPSEPDTCNMKANSASPSQSLFRRLSSRMTWDMKKESPV